LENTLSAFTSNFTLQDILGILLGFSLFPFIFVFPGYVTGWALNLFEFRKRTLIGQVVIAMPVSASITPAALFLVYRFTSSWIVIGLAFVFALAAMYICIRSYNKDSCGNEYIKPVVIFVFLWIILSIFTMIDLQIGERLYFSSNSYDLTTRVSVIDAISRTGIPPVNPSYYPGRPVLLNSLYYYWYILASVVDQMGGGLVSAYHAMVASISWAGILLFATLATYLRVRDGQSSLLSWKKSFLSIQLIAVGGLDFIMVFIIMASFNFHLEQLPFQGHVEGWNMPIMSWLNALAWVPHHLAAAIACITAMLLAMQNMQEKFIERIPRAVFIGLAFASAFGLSVWVMFVFAIFWLIWGLVLVFKEKKYQQFWFMILGGLFGIVFAAPFLLGVLQDGGASPSGGGLPVAIYIRPFMVTDLLAGFSPLVINILNFVFLPLNYLFELGFFFLMAVIWFQGYYKREGELSPIHRAELILVIVSVVILSFLRSTIIAINDLGIRGWLPVQFILVVWSSDVIFQIAGERKWISPKIFKSINGTKTLGLSLSVMLVIGYLTMGLEFFSLRAWPFLVDMNVVGFPNKLSPDTHLGERTYSARLAYTFLHDNIPLSVIVQNNPLGFLDRPSGLYGNHQMVISDRTVYGIAPEAFRALADDVGTIFTEQAENWGVIDMSCRRYSVDILIIKDLDPLWNNLDKLKKERPPLYENKHYALYACGNYATSD
jgi:hypothetical protein